MWRRLLLVLLLLLAVSLGVGQCRSQRMAEYDSLALYETIPVGCTEEEAVAHAGMAPGDYRQTYSGSYVGTGRIQDEASRKSVSWSLDQGKVVLYLDESGRVVAKQHRVPAWPRESLWERIRDELGR